MRTPMIPNIPTIILLGALVLAACLPAVMAQTTTTASATTTSGSSSINTNVTSPTVVGSDVILNIVNQNPDPAQAGNPLEIRIGVQNQGQQTQQNLDVELIPSYPFTTLPGESLVQTISTLGYAVDQNVQILKFDMGVDPQAVAGTYTLKVWTYTDGNRNTHTETTIPVTVQNLQNVQVIYLDKSVLVPGQVTPLTFTINNVGKSPLNQLTFSWSNSANIILPVNGAVDRYIDSLGVGQSVNVTYDVIASTSANPDLYPLNLLLDYNNPVSGGQSEFSTVAGVYVGGGTDFAVSFDSSSGGSTALNIANTGANPATAVAVSIPTNQTGWYVTGSRTSVIGSLAKGDYTIASFNLMGSSRAPLNVEVDYTNTMGDRQTVIYPVDMNGAGSGGNLTGGYGGFGGARNGSAGGFGGSRASSTNITAVILEAVAALVIIVGIIFGIYAFQRRNTRKKMLEKKAGKP